MKNEEYANGREMGMKVGYAGITEPSLTVISTRVSCEYLRHSVVNILKERTIHIANDSLFPNLVENIECHSLVLFEMRLIENVNSITIYRLRCFFFKLILNQSSQLVGFKTLSSI